MAAPTPCIHSGVCTNLYRTPFASLTYHLSLITYTYAPFRPFCANSPTYIAVVCAIYLILTFCAIWRKSAPTCTYKYYTFCNKLGPLRFYLWIFIFYYYIFYYFVIQTYYTICKYYKSVIQTYYKNVDFVIIKIKIKNGVEKSLVRHIQQTSSISLH